MRAARHFISGPGAPPSSPFRASRDGHFSERAGTPPPRAAARLASLARRGRRRLALPLRGLLPIITLTIIAAASLTGNTGESLQPAGDPVATFSILGYDPATGEVGGTVQSRVFSAGNGVLWAEAGVGVVATQAIVDVSYGPQALELLRRGLAPADIVKQVWEKDPDPRPDNWTKQGRQFAVMNAKGDVAAFTGPKATAWAGHKIGKFCSAQGNILAGEAVVANMVEAFEKTTGHLELRLLAALEAGQAAGGDTRGMQSAAMLIVKKNGGVWLNNDTVLRLQVDDNPEPIKELRRLVEKAGPQLERNRRANRGD
jgi:uncharacterized Ntn-hydrolase superfamily protein